MVSERAASYMRRRKSDEKVQEVGGSFSCPVYDGDGGMCISDFGCSF